MMTQPIISYYDAIHNTEFKQASVYIDACFLLSYVDHDNDNGDRAAKLIDLWSRQGIKKVGISNHVFVEVVNFLFRRRILGAMSLMHQQNKRRHLDETDIDEIGEFALANKLIEVAGDERFPGTRKMDFILRGQGDNIHFHVPDMLKAIKRLQVFNDALLHHYDRAMDDYEEAMSIFTDNGIAIETLNSDFDVQQMAASYVRLMGLDAPDALHLAATVSHAYDFFVTMDNDFVHNHYESGHMGVTKIVSAIL